MVPYEINGSGTCSSCDAIAVEQHILECFTCRRTFHAECDNNASFATKSFVKSFKGLRNNINFFFVCDHCITNRENTEASSLKQQMAEVVASVSRLAKEVSDLKKEGSGQTSVEVPVADKNVAGESPGTTVGKNPDSSKKSKTERKVDNKFTLCIKNDGGRIDMTKVREVVTSNGVQVSKASVNHKTGDLYVDLPSTEEREKLVPLLREEALPGNTIVNIKTKCPVINIKNVADYVSEEDFIGKIKAQNPKIREKLENGSEFTVVFTKEFENIQRDTQPGIKVHQVVARVSQDIREVLKMNNDRIFIGFSAHRIFDRFYIKTCAKCHRFGHYHANCSDHNPCCGYCSSEDHVSDNCPVKAEKDVRKYKCVNCNDAGKTSDGHSSYWFKCPAYLEQQNKMKINIPYYAKNCC